MPRRPNQADSSLIIRSRIAALAVAGWSTRRISEDVDLSNIRLDVGLLEVNRRVYVRCPGRARVTTEAEDDATRQNANELRFTSLELYDTLLNGDLDTTCVASGTLPLYGILAVLHSWIHALKQLSNSKATCRLNKEELSVPIFHLFEDLVYVDCSK
ncbi:hypothetical protein FQR65_LT12318 [Abscondita terminalis]|nr:hypothetical protein FQR65_LT12318 [Abscondita terminalis]